MTKFLKIKKLVSRHTKGFQAINEHMLLQNCGGQTLDKAIENLVRFAAGNTVSANISMNC